MSPLLALSGHWSLHCTCPLLIQSGHFRCPRGGPPFEYKSNIVAGRVSCRIAWKPANHYRSGNWRRKLQSASDCAKWTTRSVQRLPPPSSAAKKKNQTRHGLSQLRFSDTEHLFAEQFASLSFRSVGITAQSMSFAKKPDHLPMFQRIDHGERFCFETIEG